MIKAGDLADCLLAEGSDSLELIDGIGTSEVRRSSHPILRPTLCSTLKAPVHAALTVSIVDARLFILQFYVITVISCVYTAEIMQYLISNLLVPL